MEWRGVTITNVYVANFFFAAAFGLVVTAQWELSIGNGFAYTVFSAFGEQELPVKTESDADRNRTFLRRLRGHPDTVIWYHSSVRRRCCAIEQCARLLHDSLV